MIETALEGLGSTHLLIDAFLSLRRGDDSYWTFLGIFSLAPVKENGT